MPPVQMLIIHILYIHDYPTTSLLFDCYVGEGYEIWLTVISRELTGKKKEMLSLIYK